jgi:hypothetical protein
MKGFKDILRSKAIKEIKGAESDKFISSQTSENENMFGHIYQNLEKRQGWQVRGESTQGRADQPAWMNPSTSRNISIGR